MRKNINIPIYGSKILLIYDEDFDIPGYDNEEFDNDTGVTIFYLDENVYYCGIRPSTFSQSVITHESVHLAHRILECVGVKTNYLEDEAEAYLAGWIAKEIVNAIYDYEDEKFNDLPYMKNIAI